MPYVDTRDITIARMRRRGVCDSRLMRAPLRGVCRARRGPRLRIRADAGERLPARLAARQQHRRRGVRRVPRKQRAFGNGVAACALHCMRGRRMNALRAPPTVFKAMAWRAVSRRARLTAGMNRTRRRDRAYSRNITAWKKGFAFLLYTPRFIEPICHPNSPRLDWSCGEISS